MQMTFPKRSQADKIDIAAGEWISLTFGTQAMFRRLIQDCQPPSQIAGEGETSPARQ